VVYILELRDIIYILHPAVLKIAALARSRNMQCNQYIPYSFRRIVVSL
jgi:hypothetical protein